MLKSIVENRHRRSICRSSPDSLCALRLDNDWNLGIQTGMNQRLVSAISTQYNGGLSAPLRELCRQPRSKWCFPGSAH
jgi:hypothetical protein